MTFFRRILCILIFTWTTERNRGGRAAVDDGWEVESVGIVRNLCKAAKVGITAAYFDVH